MLVQSLGPFTWLFKKNNTQLIINSRLDTCVDSHFNSSGNYKYRGAAITCIPKHEERTILIQLSDQYQYLSTSGISNLRPDKVVTHPNTVVESLADPLSNTENAKFGKWYTEDMMEYCIVGPKKGETFWDNVGASIFVKCRHTDLLVFIQGSNGLPISSDSSTPKKVDISILTWNSYSTINSSSSFYNVYDKNEFYQTEDDLKLLMNIIDSAPLSDKYVLQGSDFINDDEFITRNRLEYYMNLIAPYLLSCGTEDVQPGAILTGTPEEQNGAFDINKSTLKRHSSTRSISTDEDGDDLIDEFFEALGKIVLLTEFGKTMFGHASIQNIALTEYRFSISLTMKNGRYHNRMFNITNNKFERFEGDSLDEIRTIFPFGISVDIDDLISVLKGKSIFWDLANSKNFSQWYIGDPKTSPVTLMYLYFQEVCNLRQIKQFWSNYNEPDQRTHMQVRQVDAVNINRNDLKCL